LSQGLALPLDILPPNFDMCADVLKPGLDVTDVLGVRKYEPPETGGVNGYVYGAPMPLFVPRTDEVQRRQPDPGRAGKPDDRESATHVQGSQ
jgi:hypothetical protein